ncbi:ATP-binding protein [Bacillus sp. KH172YL63]|uniref:ATP-binding protein n=1 Tax=Bacillus sp. KH172YL63 TaxID=2709784 RepID=UPI0013E46321|nr:ATP-binding protein [Bacillus sp. KH172YL63]BCB03988.1 sporulation kinase [Bacillus sp. KH172YL63]
MNIFKDFLLQFTLMVIPIFSYFTFILERVKKDRWIKLVMTMLWGLSILLCMSFPVEYGEGARLDIRFVPLLLGTLYLGVWPGILLSILIILYRLSFGMSLGVYITMLILALAMPVILSLQHAFIRGNRTKRVMMAVSIAAGYCLGGMSIAGMFFGFSPDYVKVQLIHLAFTVTVTWICVILIEKIREMHELRLNVQDAEKFRLISELTGVFAHEIRNPMQVAKGFLQLLDAPDLPDKKREYINVSIEELDRANDIISDFLAFGKPSGHTYGRINVGDQLKRVTGLIQTFSLTQQVEFETSIEKDCWIMANPQKLNQSLINIVKNGVESMPDGGKVEIGCSKTVNGDILITIRDQGIGMSAEQIDRLGSPYYSLKEKGTGLGMMVSFQIIRALNGRITVRSEEGVGTEFQILFPLAESDEVVPPFSERSDVSM